MKYAKSQITHLENISVPLGYTLQLLLLLITRSRLKVEEVAFCNEWTKHETRNIALFSKRNCGTL